MDNELFEPALGGGMDMLGAHIQNGLTGDITQADGYTAMIQQMADAMRSMSAEGVDASLFRELKGFLHFPDGGLPGDAAQAIQGGYNYYFLRDNGAPGKARGLNPASSNGFDVHSVRKDFPVLHQEVHGDKPLIWLDNAATSQKPNMVIDAISNYYRHYNSNIHRAAHALAAKASDAYENAREKVQRFMGAGSKDEIVFVRGTTEAINLVAQTYGKRYIQPGDEIVISGSSHHANIVPWQMLAREKNAYLNVIPFNDAGELQLDELKKLLNPRVKIVAVDHVSNVLGTVNPIEQITKMAHENGSIIVVDGAQAVPHMRPSVQAVGCDFYVFSGHKVFGPTGIGVLYGNAKHLADIPPYHGGGNMIAQVTFEHTTYNPPPSKFEAGTGNIADAIGLGAAIDYLDQVGFDAAAQYEHSLLEYGMAGLAQIPGLKLIGTAPGKVSVMSFVADGVRNEDMGQWLDSQGIAVRSGHHCAQPTLAHYGLTSCVRPSLAFYNTKEEVEKLILAVEQGIHKLKK
jgi:cysteine desulfurase / selenocysteine lyase